MKNNPQPSHTNCFNCGAAVMGDFCHECGQRVRDNSDRSLGRLIVEVFNNIFFFDNRFFISVWYLLRFPGRMTVDFLAGKRKKFISPVTLFLFLNLIYFLVNPLTDYSVSLYDQLYSQPYSELTKPWINDKMQEEGLNEQTYGPIYQHASDNLSKSIMFLNIPLIGFFVYLMAFWRRKFYFDSLIFAAHFFSLFMFSLVLLDWSGELLNFLTGDIHSIIGTIFFAGFTLFVPLFYAMVSMKKFMDIRWYWSIPLGFGIMVSVILCNLIYRFIILAIILWTT